MRIHRNSHCTMVGLAAATLLALFVHTGSAQQQPGISSGLRKTQQQEERQLTPVARTLIHVEIWLNKQCGAAFYPEDGESMPLASNSTEAGRQRNRRVELEIRYER